MLRTLARPSAPRLASSCPACRAALTSSRPSPLASTSALSSSTAVAASRTATTTLRAPWTTLRQLSSTASTSPLPQEQQDAQAEEEEEQPTTTRPTEQEEMDSLLATFESTLQSTEPPPPTLTPTPSRPSPPPLSPSLLLSPNFPSGPPTTSDLETLAPRHYTLPTPLSPDSHRIIYSKTFDAAFSRLDNAFNKAQLLSLVSRDKEEGGLGLDLSLEGGAEMRERWKRNVKAKKSKHWAPKKWDKMSKRELTMAVMVLHWGMENPETLPSGKKGPQKVDAVPLDDKTLFLLLSPHSTIIPSLSTQLGVSYSFSRNPQTSVLSLILRGNVSSVEKAKTEIEGVVDTAFQRTFHLPRPATTLRPEVYQAISRVAKAFLEPSKSPEEEDHVLIATAAEEKFLERAEQYLLTAFTLDHHRLSLPLFASLPTSLTTQRYSMYPFQPPFRPAFLHGGSTTSYARIRAITAPCSSSAGVGEREPTPFEELMSWSSKMGVQPLDRFPLGRAGESRKVGMERLARGVVNEEQRRGGMGEMDTVMGALESGFERGEKFTSTTTAAAEEGEGEAEEEWDLKASFGHVLWPLYSRPGGMGPVLEGEWGLEELLEWRGREKKGAGARGVWCGSPPSNFLSTTGVLTPTTPTTSPFSALLSPSSPPSPLSEAHRITSTSPVLDNTGFRRLVYLPVELPSAEGEGGRAEKRVEIEFAGGWEVKRRCEVREMKVEVVVPSGASDLQFTLTKRKNLPESAMPDFPTTNSTDPPLHLTINSTPYILSTDYWIRRTIVDVPPPSSEPMEHELVSSATEAKQQILPTKQVQETFHDRSPAHEGSRGIEVSLYLGGTSSLAAPSPSSSPSSDSEEPDSRNLHDLLRSGKWKKMLEALERKACEVRDRQGMPVGKGVEGRVFGAGR